MRDPNCLFCKIASKEIPADVVLDEDDLLAFRDINPVAPTHVLVVPKDHIASLEQISGDHAFLLEHLVKAANLIAARDGTAGGWRLVTNIGPDAGQSVPHLHLHVLGGRTFGWPPG